MSDEIDSVGEFLAIIKAIIDQRDRYREALEWYAKFDDYRGDATHVARAALQDERE